jgi:hypothetical protein
VKKIAAQIQRSDIPDIRRRTLVTTMLAAAGVTLIPGKAVLAQAFATGVATAPTSFMQVSTILTGQKDLDATLAARLYAAMVGDDPGFADRHQKLHAYITEKKADPALLQKMLDAENSPLAKTPRVIVSGWYTGIVGDGERARCIAFEKNLLNVLTSDKLKPPSYSYGVYGSWVAKPV